LGVPQAGRGDAARWVQGSDELWGSYNFSYHALAGGQDWHAYRRGLWRALERKNFSRNNKIFLAHAVECRTPFCHYPLVELALGLPQAVVRDGTRFKAVLQEAFRGRLPDEVVYRPKEAFQDGMGLKRSIAAMFASHELNPRAFYAQVYAELYVHDRQVG